MSNKGKEKFDQNYPFWMLFILAIVCGGLYFILKIFYQIEFEKKELKKVQGPFVVIGNHCSLVDFILMSMAVFPKRIHFLMSDVFLAKWWGPMVFRILQQIPKRQFFAEANSVRQLKRVIQAGGNIGIYPEGKISQLNRTGYVAPAIGKLVKSFHVPVVMVKEEGLSLIRPMWSGQRRWFGKVRVRSWVLLSKEEIEALDAQEIYQRICQGLAYDDFAWQQQENRSFYCTKPAENLELILHRCPACSCNQAMNSQRKQLTCECCGFQVSVDARHAISITYLPEGVLPSMAFPTTPGAWYDWQAQLQYKELLDPSYIYSCEAEIRCMSKAEHQPRALGPGSLELTGAGIKLYMPDVCVAFPAGQLPTITGSLGHYIDLPTADVLYRAVFRDPRETIIWMQATEALYQGETATPDAYCQSKASLSC